MTAQNTDTFQVFVSRPYDNQAGQSSYWTDLLKLGILPAADLVSQRSDYKVKFYDASLHRDVIGVPGKIGRAIDKSDIFLCVLTEYRPSVLWETGYAQKLELPTIYLLALNLFGSKAPILIGVPDTLYYNAAEGTFSELPEQLVAYLIKACDAADLRRRKQSERYDIGPIYSATCYKDRASLHFPQRVRRAEKHIGILTTNIDYFVNPDPRGPKDDQFQMSYFEEALSEECALPF